jgi:hypothetical protein
MSGAKNLFKIDLLILNQTLYCKITTAEAEPD